MKRSHAALFVCAFILCSHTGFAASPNIIMIISDDQTYTDFGFMGNPQVQTPHLDRLASQSAVYVNGYVPTSVCSPSLATLLTGMYPHQSGLHYNHPPPGNSAMNRMTSLAEYESVRSQSFKIIQKLDTLPRLLHEQAGYRTLQTGKFWEGHYRNAGFTEGMTLFKPVPGQTFGGSRRLADGTLAAHGNGDSGLKIGRETMRPIYDFIDDCEETPFLVWYAPYLPHQPHDSPQKYFDRYQDQSGIPKHRVPYYASISQFDDTVGQLIQFIEKKGLAENTIFLFVTDNGWEASTTRNKKNPREFDHTKRSKRAPFDYGLRTPIMIRWDNQVTPAKHQQLISSVDIVPTLLQAAGVNVPANLPGINLLPSAMGKETLDENRTLFGEIFPGDASTLGNPAKDIAYRWARQHELKLIIPHSHQGKNPWNNYLQEPALFDVVADPDEMNSLIDDPRYAEQVKLLTQQLNEWWSPASLKK
ncbi:MAG: sulfatase-like hydrolase/transferase [Pirellulales bacterium]